MESEFHLVRDRAFRDLGGLTSNHKSPKSSNDTESAQATVIPRERHSLVAFRPSSFHGLHVRYSPPSKVFPPLTDRCPWKVSMRKSDLECTLCIATEKPFSKYIHQVRHSLLPLSCTINFSVPTISVAPLVLCATIGT